MPKILIVDDKKANLIAMEALLENCGAELFTATSGNEALALLLEHEFALALLDVQMPEMDGYEVAELMRRNHATADVPIIFVTAISKEERHVFKGYESGAVDYLFKPVDPCILRSKVKIFIELWEDNDALARTIVDLETANQTILAQQEELRQLAIHDHLTGTYQRRWFDEMIEKNVAQALRSREPLSLAMLDIDHFKQVNDTYGHAVGDQVLVQLAMAVENSLRTADTVFRYGGEEFAVLMPNTELSFAVEVCERIRKNVASSAFVYDGGELAVSISIGVAELLSLDQPVSIKLLVCADNHLYRAKEQGRNRVCSGGDN